LGPDLLPVIQACSGVEKSGPAYLLTPTFA
jgi:hypothetical protein